MGTGGVARRWIARSLGVWAAMGIAATAFIALIVSPASAADAPAATLEGTVGWDGWIRPGEWNPVVVTVRAGPRPLDGDLALDVPRGMDAPGVRIRKPLRLAAFGSQTVRWSAIIRDIRRPPVLSFQVRGKPVATAELAIDPRRATLSIIGVLKEGIGGLGRLSRPMGQRGVAAISEEDLPEDAAAYTSLHALVVESLDERRLSREQREAIQSWIVHGGRVLVTAPVAPDGALAQWLLPGTAGPRRDMPPGGLPGISRAARLWEIHPRAGARVVQRNGVPIVVSAPRGFGHVWMWAVESQDVVAESPMWREILDRPEPLEILPEAPDQGGRAPFGFAAAGLAIYWALVTSAARLARTGAGRVLLLPLAIAVGAAGVHGLSSLMQQRAATMERQSVVVVAERDGWTVGRAQGMSIYGGPAAQQLPPRAAVSIEGEYRTAQVVDGPNVVLAITDHRPGQRVVVRWEGREPIEARGRIDAAKGELRLEGEATRLDNALLVRRDRTLPVGRIRGDRVTFDPNRWETGHRSHQGLDLLRQARGRASDIILHRPVLIGERSARQGRSWMLLFLDGE
ncbi:MAG: hypothetical protein FJX78_00365 [Armatimonadetes bacterium]|nr:hypothetical protein [Armatimonadota bacterium]